MDFLNPEQFSAAKQRKKPTTSCCPSYSSSLPCCSSTQEGPRGFILLRDLGLLPTVCFFPRCLGRIFLLLLFLNGSLPTPQGPLLPYDNSLLAAPSLLAKMKSTGEDEACQSFFHAR